MDGRARTVRRTSKASKGKIVAKPARCVDIGTRRAILDAALKVFARDGFDGASLPKIAELAHTAHPLIHYHFGSKDNLWRETVEYACGALLTEAAATGTASRGLSPIDKLRVLIRTFTRYAACYPDNLAMIMAEARSGSKRLAWLRANYTDVFLNRLQKALKEAQEARQIKQIPMRHLSFILMGAMLLYFAYNFTPPKGADRVRAADEHFKWLLEALFNGIAIR